MNISLQVSGTNMTDTDDVLEEFASFSHAFYLDVAQDMIAADGEEMEVDGKIKCPHCGARTNEDGNFCTVCGRKIIEICDCWILNRPYNCGHDECPSPIELFKKARSDMAQNERREKGTGTSDRGINQKNRSPRKSYFRRM